jgi:capsular exopolysaccharide synthesis family protein
VKKQHNTKLDSHLVSLTAPSSFAAEQYQGLRLTIERMGRSRDVKVIGITSPASGDGKTVTSINLAGALARGADERVLLIDADLRRPAVARQLGITDARRGLADALMDPTLGIADVVQPLDRHNLDICPAGSVRGGVSQILRSPRLDAFIQQARQRYAYIIVDTPPLLPVFDSTLLAKSMDGVLMVVSANQTPRKLLGEALNMLEADKVLGIVFNRDERPLFGYYNSYYREYFPDVSQVASEA